MLKEAKKALRITKDEYDSEIAIYLEAGARDLEISGVVLPGKILFEESDGVIQDLCTVTDRYVMNALFSYVKAYFGDPKDRDMLLKMYDNQKGNLGGATGYTDFGEEKQGGDSE